MKRAGLLFLIDKLRMNQPWLRPASWSACLAAVLIVSVAALLRLAAGWPPLTLPFVTFYPAVLLAAFLGGAASGLLAAVLALPIGWLVFMPPGYSIRFDAAGLPHPVVLFIVFSAINIAVVGALHAALSRLRSLTSVERAHESEKLQRLADALHNVAFGLVIVDNSTKTIQFANPAYAALRGMALEQLIGLDVCRLYTPAERVRLSGYLDTADRTGRVTYNTEFIRPDGSSMPVQVDITSVRGVAGQAPYRIGTVTDAAERRRADAMTAALHALDARLRQILDETPIAMTLMEPGTLRFVWVNATMCRMLEYDSTQLIGRTGRDIVHPGDNPTPIVELSDTVPEWQPTHRRLVASSGRILHARTRAVRLGPDSSGAELVLGLAEDVTQQVHTEEALRQAQKMEAIGNLAGGIAHDFNNLLGVVIGNLDIIESMMPASPEIAELLKDATDAALRGADLTRNLLAFARRQPLQPVELPVNAVITDITRFLARVLSENLTISLDLSPEVWPVIADKGQLESCIVNLATNARDAIPRGGTLRIATGNRQIDAGFAAVHQNLRPGDYVMIEVSDNGFGMAPDVLDRIFEPFFSTKPSDKGSGLGLSMVFGFIRQSNGHISVDSEPGSGSTFRLFLPRAVSVDATTAVIEAGSSFAGNGETVLVVEDNAALRRIAVRQVAELGYRVLEADGAEAALNHLGDRPVHVLFTDVVMPGRLNGIELARQARALQPDIKVLLTSGFSEHVTDPSVAVANVARLLNKPYRAEDLARELQATLQG